MSLSIGGTARFVPNALGRYHAAVRWRRSLMDQKRLALLLVTAILLSCLPIRTAAQDANARVLLAAIADARGNAVVDLAIDDFVVSEGGRDRDVLDVHIADYPVGLLIDDSGPPALWPTLRAAAARFITRIGERPIAVGVLSNATPAISELDVDRASLQDRLNAFAPGPVATPAPLQAIAAMSRQLKDTGSPFSAIVVVAAAPVNASGPVRTDLLPVILDSGAAVHVVEARPAAADASSQTADLLQVLADQTHGLYTTIFSNASYAIALDRLADRLAAEMMVQYLVPPGERTEDVKVGVRRPGARVLGRGVSK